ncbi:hypothetical protein [Salinispora fenicalii]|uniref:hypothetical protein n=1 Tax=Salinispora fenicalii TaxID=1137263 RepID=UPI0004B0958D|nr:hypothetical protein [Salinispora fenicalii]
MQSHAEGHGVGVVVVQRDLGHVVLQDDVEALAGKDLRIVTVVDSCDVLDSRVHA